MAKVDRNGAWHSERNGRFIEKNKNSSARKKKQEDLEKARRIYSSDYFPPTNDLPEGIPPLPTGISGFKDSKRKNTKHHKDHAKEMGFKNQDEYEKAALAFWKNGEGKYYFSKPRNSFYKYNEKTKEFLSVHVRGYTRTFMFKSKKAFEKLIREEQLYVY